MAKYIVIEEHHSLLTQVWEAKSLLDLLVKSGAPKKCRTALDVEYFIAAGIKNCLVLKKSKAFEHIKDSGIYLSGSMYDALRNFLQKN